jgi:hypothetical protein
MLLPSFGRDFRGEGFSVCRARTFSSARRELTLCACSLRLCADFRDEDFAVFGARAFFGGRPVAGLCDLSLGLGAGIRFYFLRLTARPCLWYNQGFQALRDRDRAGCAALE